LRQVHAGKVRPMESGTKEITDKEMPG